MKSSRALALRSELLTDLQSDEMRRIIGGSHLCTTDYLTHGNTCEAKCEAPTNPINHCLSMDDPGECTFRCETALQ